MHFFKEKCQNPLLLQQMNKAFTLFSPCLCMLLNFIAINRGSGYCDVFYLQKGISRKVHIALCSENLKAVPVVSNVGSLNTFAWRRKFSEFLQTSALWSWAWGELALHTLRKQLAWVEDSPFEKTGRETEALDFLRGETLWSLAMFSTLDKQQLKEFT